MSLALDQPIRCLDSGEARFTPRSLLLEGRSFDLVLADDAENPDKKAVLKAIRYARTADKEYTEHAREHARREARVLDTPHPGLPMPLAELVVHNPLLDELGAEVANQEPILAYEFAEGLTLDAWVRRQHPRGVPVSEALRVVADVARVLDAIHEHGFVHRAVAPEHVIRRPDGEITLVGLGNAARPKERCYVDRPWTIERFSAPELMGELSGRFTHRKADVYSLGALLAFLVTAEEPTGEPASPYTRIAYERLNELPDGVGLLIAHCMQPFHKKRYARTLELAELMTPETLPTAQTKKFGEIALLAPWKGDRPESQRVGHLTAGPLVNRPADSPPHADAEDGSSAAQAPERVAATSNPRYAVFLVVVAILTVLALIALLRTVGVIGS